MLQPEYFFNLEGHRFAPLFEGLDHVWGALDRLPEYLSETIVPNVAALRAKGEVVARTVVLWQEEVLDDGFTVEVGDVKRGGLVVHRGGERLDGASLVKAGAIIASDDIEIGRGSIIEPTALVKGPTIIGDNSEIRHGAYVRGKVLVGDGCVVGHATEMKGSIMLHGSQAGHFAYLGDSILGAVNLGAGTKLANLRVFSGNVTVLYEGERIDTGRRKFGAILGEGVELGCNSVTSPGTLLGRRAVAYPNTTVRGFHPQESVLKSTGAATDGGNHKP